MDPMNNLLLEHIARYQFSISYAYGRVLDIASGSGYGTQLIAKVCKGQVSEVVGADNSAEAVEYARGRYYHPLTNFVEADVLDNSLRKKLGTFDTILSFETIEHVEDDKLFMENMYSLLNDKGILILSTPFGEGKGKPCGEPFHCHQFTEEEFSGLFKAFSSVEFFYQKSVLIEPVPGREGADYPLGIAVARK
ncbi:class I SAM-dependent methyltransferase [Bacillus marinisedimentorum]|uniref:class I SAM-dependent methyltransferase n=1 Tax=Bacillus marinisedimentorum TaxID=1821260 RepID=UPI0008720CB1|nr:class I SAM-dependent methyltransferase [Bacillus marinisedimentorum]